jgi:hypothetical protein
MFMRHPEVQPENQDNTKLQFIARLMQTVVPEYDIRQSDPLEAAESGIGNCVAKAAISAVLLGRGKFTGAKPALAWNTNTHPKHGSDLFGAPRILNGHAYLLVSNNNPPYTISGISYNPDGISSSSWEIFNFNDDGEFAVVQNDGSITTTEAGATVGYVVDDWHAGSKSYMEALGIFESVYHRTTPERLSAMIIGKLVEKDMLIDLS